jgi:hypothetical protein
LQIQRSREFNLEVLLLTWLEVTDAIGALDFRLGAGFRRFAVFDNEEKL